MDITEIYKKDLKRIALSLMISFPKVKAITVSRESTTNNCSLDLWKTDNLIETNGVFHMSNERNYGYTRYNNSFICSRSKNHLFCSINLKRIYENFCFCDFNDISDFKFTRNDFKIFSSEKKVNEYEKLKKYFLPISKVFDLKSLVVQRGNWITMKKKNNELIKFNARGCGLNTKCKSEILFD